MKTVAIIPARKGSKGVPNKNIRLLNDKPLICYAIENALSCDMIDEVVVTTDSDEVEIIAKQMGAKVVRRREELCGDAVTLDSVVFNAVNQITDSFDTVVTMQPTSPTLKVETLNQSLRFFESSTLDTLISVVNKPHLSWSLDNGRPVKNYIERKNRQYLPENYLETGAFIITKIDFVLPDNRFGDEVGVYEISSEESIDIDTFDDFVLCERILKKEKVAFYVNGNTARGLGHIYRCLELADEFYHKPDIYYDANQTPVELFGDTTHNLISIDGIHELFDRVKSEKYTLFINDILNTSIDYMIALRNCNESMKVVNFEDDGEGVLKADLIINALYDDPLVPQMKVGERYYICNKLFLFYKPISIRRNIRDIFISFGGADPQNYTDRLLDIVAQDKYKSFTFHFVLGRAKQNVERLMAFNNISNINVLFDIRNMPEIMSKCDIAITSRGRTGYELALLGIPTIAMAQNKREEHHGFVCNENGFNYIGLNPADSIIEKTLDYYLDLNLEERASIQCQLLDHNLRHGRKRVFNLINNI